MVTRGALICFWTGRHIPFHSLWKGGFPRPFLKTWSLMSIATICTYYQVAFLEDSEETFRSSSQAATCPPVYHTRWRIHASPFYCWTSSREIVNTNFCNFEFDPTGNRAHVNRFSYRRQIYSTLAIGLKNPVLWRHTQSFAHLEGNRRIPKADESRRCFSTVGIPPCFWTGIVPSRLPVT